MRAAWHASGVTGPDTVWFSTLRERLNLHRLRRDRREHVADDQVVRGGAAQAHADVCCSHLATLPVRLRLVARLPVQEVVFVHDQRLKVLVAAG